MKNIFLIVIAWLMFGNAAFAQHICGTERPDSATVVQLPWYNNNQYLLDLVDSIEQANGVGQIYQQGQGILPNEVGGVTETIFQVPMP
jgi:hypothetical protein